MQIPNLYIADSELHGRGVFCGEDIQAGSLIEICPVLILTPEHLAIIEKTSLYDYYFQWGANGKEGAICLGLGSIYNHSFSSNAAYTNDFESNTITIHAVQEIKAGNEITINYNGDVADQTKVWFMK